MSSQLKAIAKAILEVSQQDKQQENQQQSQKVLPGEMAVSVAREILDTMPEDADVVEFTGKAIAQIAAEMDKEAEKLSVKIPTAQELIDYTGPYTSEIGTNDLETTGLYSLKKIGFVKLEEQKAKNAKKETEIIKKLVNSRYDLSDFADITFSDANKAKQIVIAAAHKGKFLHLTINSSDAYFKKMLKKCTMH